MHRSMRRNVHTYICVGRTGTRETEPGGALTGVLGGTRFGQQQHGWRTRAANCERTRSWLVLPVNDAAKPSPRETLNDAASLRPLSFTIILALSVSGYYVDIIYLSSRYVLLSTIYIQVYYIDK